MRFTSPDPSIPRKPYDPTAPNPGIEELNRQKAAGETPNPARALAAIQESHGFVKENDKWVKDEPYLWEGDGA
jgi:hypothetical protein